MGWCFAGLERLPQQNHSGKEWSFAHVQCSKRMYCSIDYIANRLTNKDGTSMVYAANRERDNNFTTDIDIQTLQRFDEDPYVIVRNYSGGFNFWYLCLVQQAKLEILEGKRILKRYATIAVSKANARSRDAESTSHDDVQWAIEEGSHSLTLVEADESSVDVVFDSLGCFKREVQALEHFIVFGHIVMRWDQQLSPSNLLKFLKHTFLTVAGIGKFHIILF
ncbi:hypothetical protein AM587_10001803 [Phytophthora nicotianae]|uniref:Uncharacterized protein n=1 Tax=Phytophthora nicotianae TaxID=4792 RepID=A0A0W8C6C0_PHYNI|nr:hypothetical protein AM587_10001803 [Phytophthora nicotianae]